MIIPLGKPETPCIQNASIYSRWNSVHNQSYFKLLRKDALVISTSAYLPLTQNKLVIVVSDADSSGYNEGDTIYIAGYDKVTTIVSINFNVGGTGNTNILTDIAYSAIAVDYINNHTKYYGLYLETRVITRNSITGLITTHEPFTSFPDTKGYFYVKPHGYCLRELKKLNKSPYSFTNWNDGYAWVQYYVEGRIRYPSEFSVSAFGNILNSQALNTYGSELVRNGDFAQGNAYWGSSFASYDATIPAIVTNNNATSNKEAFPTIGFFPSNVVLSTKTYEVIINVNVSAFTSGVPFQMDVVEFTTNAVVYTTQNNGEQGFNWNPSSDNEQLFFRWNINAVGYVKSISVKEYVNVVATPPTYFFATNSVRQIQSRLNENMCEHLCVYTTIAVDANRGKFISDFERPTKFKGYPFDIGYIQHETMELAGGNVASKEQLYNYNKVATGISTFSLQAYARGEYRLRLKTTYADSDTSIDVWIEAGGALDNGYVDEAYVTSGYISGAPSGAIPAVTSRLMQVMNVKLDNKCKDNPVYLAWKGRKGAMNYWLFSKTQTIGSTIGEVQKFEPYYETLDIEGRTSVLTKSDKPSMVVGADNIDLNDIKGLVGLTASNFVQMYIGSNGKGGYIWQTINVKEGSFKYYETGNGRHDIELTLELVENYVHTL